MEFKKYQHIERIGKSSTNGIEQGTKYIFPKIDGENTQCFLKDNGYVGFGSRNNELVELNPEKPLSSSQKRFINYVYNNSSIISLLKNYDYTLYGEWLTPKTLKTYSDDAWDNFYVFDVVDKYDNYVHYDEYSKILDSYGIKYIKPLAVIDDELTYEMIQIILNDNTYLLKTGIGEGIVIKNYNYVNRFGRVVWAKVITDEFTKKHGSNKNKTKEQLDQLNIIEHQIVERYITESLVEKELHKICDGNEWDNKNTMRLLSTVFYCLVTEETWNFVKDFKNPTINFKTLNSLCINKTKELLKNILDK